MNIKRYILFLLLVGCLLLFYKAKMIADERTHRNRYIEQSIEAHISNQTGIDIASINTIINDNKISFESLQKAIKRQFPIPVQQQTNIAVSTNSDLCIEEQNYLHARMPKIMKVLNDDFQIDRPLRIGFACSGGGNRAMIGTLGFCIAAARHKFLQASLYLVGLSGSTWTIAPWSYMYAKKMFSLDLETSLKQFQNMLEGSLDYFCPLEAKACLPNGLEHEIHMSFSKNIAKHFAYNQRITVVDLYGAFIANYVLKNLGKDRLKIVWSDIAGDMQRGDIPLPLCSSVFDCKESESHRAGFNADYRWFETGPFQAGSTSLGFIPIWALGSTFEKGKLVKQAPEYEMSEFLGLYGSAFDLSDADFLKYEVPDPIFKVSGKSVSLPVNSWMNHVIDITNQDLQAKQAENVHARFANYSKGLASSMLSDVDQFGMFDGGNDFHIPLPLLFDRSARSVDVVIIYDSYPGRPHSLLDAHSYFRKVGIVMPDLQQAVLALGATQEEQRQGLLSKPMTVFNDPRSKQYKVKLPTLIYIPTPCTDISQAPYFIDLKKYPDITAPIDSSKRPYFVANFQYSPAELKNLSATMEAIFESQVNEMKHILKLVAQSK